MVYGTSYCFRERAANWQWESRGDCIWRRKRKTGQYLKRSPQPHASLAPTASEVDSWRRPRSSTLESIHPATGRADRQLRISTGGALVTPPVPSYPMRMKHRSRDSIEEEFPFFNQQHSRVDFARGLRHQPGGGMRSGQSLHRHEMIISLSRPGVPEIL